MSEHTFTQSQPNNLQNIFAVPPEETVRGYPSSKAAVDLVNEADELAEQARSRIRYQPGEEVADATEHSSKMTRRDRRATASAHIGPVRELLWSGAHYAATFETTEQAKAALEASLITSLGTLADEFTGIADGALIQAPFMRRFRGLVAQAAEEIGMVRKGGTATSYGLVRTLATEIGTTIWNNEMGADREWRPNHVLARLAILGEPGLHDALASELRGGRFNECIAVDLLRAANTGEPIDPDLARIRRLSDFALAAAQLERPDKGFQAHLASITERWPLGERQIIVSAQDILLGGMMANFNLALQRLRKTGFVEAGDPKDAFERSLTDFMEDFIARVQLNQVLPKDRAKIARMKADRKRYGNVVPGTTSRKRPGEEEEPNQIVTPEVKREPPKLVTCNLADGSFVEGVQALMDNFVSKISQGTIVAEEVQKMFDFIVRVDLPPRERRGVKSIEGTGARFGEKVYPLWEFKPTDAAGLTLRTDAAKQSRIYFIKLPDNTLGIVGIEPRSEQVEFLKSIKVKLKNR